MWLFEKRIADAVNDADSAVDERRCFVNVPGTTAVVDFYNNGRNSRSSSLWKVKVDAVKERNTDRKRYYDKKVVIFSLYMAFSDAVDVIGHERGRSWWKWAARDARRGVKLDSLTERAVVFLRWAGMRCD